MKRLFVTILAGGLGKRMESPLPKVLHKIAGTSLIVRIVREVLKLKADKIIIVVGKFSNQIREEINTWIKPVPDISYVDQLVACGTADAVKATLSCLPDETVDNIILNGDVPLLQASTIANIYKGFLNKSSSLMITAINLKNPNGSGRIIIDNGLFKEIVEEKDCTPDQKLLTMVNCGIYIVKSDILKKYIPLITNNNAQSEYYLTDLVKIYKSYTLDNVDLNILSDEKVIEIYNVNTKQQLLELEKMIH